LISPTGTLNVDFNLIYNEECVMQKKTVIRLGSLILAICFLLSAAAFAADDKEGKINLNTATKEQLVGVGLDAELADQILELREENGEFVDIEELSDIDGVDAKLIRQLKKKIFIEAAAGCNC